MFLKPIILNDSLASRFWNKVRVDVNSNCWEWTACRSGNGYGSIGGYRAHRVSWAIHNGPIPDGMLVLHRCDNPPCVNPHHLFVGDARDNANDMVDKKRHQLKRPIGQDATGAKLTNDNVRDIWAQLQNGTTQWRIARQYGVCAQYISAIKLGQYWSHITTEIRDEV